MDQKALTPGQRERGVVSFPLGEAQGLGQWAAWAAGSDAIEAGYIAARAAVEGAGDEAAVAAVLVGLGWG